MMPLNINYSIYNGLSEIPAFDPGLDKTEEMIDKMDGAIAMKLLDKLPKAYKNIIVMRYVEELTIPEIAAALKEKENNISVKLYRGIEKLKQAYKYENN